MSVWLLEIDATVPALSHQDIPGPRQPPRTFPVTQVHGRRNSTGLVRLANEGNRSLSRIKNDRVQLRIFHHRFETSRHCWNIGGAVRNLWENIILRGSVGIILVGLFAIWYGYTKAYRKLGIEKKIDVIYYFRASATSTL